MLQTIGLFLHVENERFAVHVVPFVGVVAHAINADVVNVTIDGYDEGSIVRRTLLVVKRDAP